MDIIDGKYIANGDKNVFVKILGQGGIPVVFETGWGSLSVEYDYIQKELSKHTTVITYDRAGYGESPSATHPRVSAQIAGELYTMLQESEIQGPYILVGHNGGGLYVQHFAKMFALETAGILLIDSISTFDDEFDKLDAPNFIQFMSHQTKIDNFRQYSEIEPDDFEPMVAPLLKALAAYYPENIREAIITYQSDKKFYKTIYNELIARDESLSLIKQLSMFTNIPVKILCRDPKVMIDISTNAGIPEEEARFVEELWLKNSKDMMNLSTGSSFEIVEGAGHIIHLDKPDIVIKSVLDILEKAKEL